MLFASIYALVQLLVDILVVRARSESERDLELLALRQEVAVLRRHRQSALARATGATSR